DSAVCPGGFVVVGTSFYFTTGSYVDTLTTSIGCDSIVTLNLTVLSVPITRLNIIICSGDSVIVGSSVYRNAGTYNNIFTGTNGCDSIVITRVAVRFPVFTTLNPRICLGQTFAVGTSVYNVSGTYFDTLVAANICDSIITTHLTVI